MSADRFAGHTPGPWVVQQHRSEAIGFFVSWNHIALAQQASKQDAELMAAAPELLAENERLKVARRRAAMNNSEWIENCVGSQYMELRRL
jgi:hypothetical protein